MTDTQTAFVLVPREPTEEMLEASVSPRYEFLTDAHVSVLKDGFAAKYRAMLSAAPKPPESEIGPVAWRRRLMNSVEDVGGRKAGTWSEWNVCTLQQAEYAMLTGGVQHFSPPLRAEAEPLYPQARIDADAAIIAALRAEVVRLQSFADGYGKLDADFAIAERRAEAAEARVKELEAAIDSAETNAGLTDNGNLWRFWSAKASDLAASLKQTEGWLEGRDAFLVKRGLWTDFVDQLPASPSRAALASKKETVDE